MPSLSAGYNPDDMASALAQMVDEVWKTKGISEAQISEAVTTAFAKEIWKGVTDAFGGDLDKFDYDTPDYEMLSAIQKNVWQFSAAKNYQQLRALSDALIGADGKLLSKSDFLKAASAINDQFIKRYGATEYDLAVAGSQMASKWVAIQRDAATLGFIEFDAVLDTQTTALCRSLDGIIVKWDSDFAKRYYPPNHFGCRLTVRQRGNVNPTPASQLSYPDIQPMFATNMAQSGLVFPAKHPYFTDMPENIRMQADALLKKQSGL